jgi:hypothetical protein
MSTENDRLAKFSENQVFAEIGRSLLGEHFGAVRLSDEEAERAGRSWFQSVLPAIGERICGDPIIQEQLLDNAAAARNTALLAVLDTLLAGLFYGLPVATISHAVALYGIHKICDGGSTGGST